VQSVGKKRTWCWVLVSGCSASVDALRWRLGCTEKRPSNAAFDGRCSSMHARCMLDAISCRADDEWTAAESRWAEKKRSFWDVSFLGHVPYRRSPKNPALQQLQKSSKSASTTPHYDPAEADLEHFFNSWSAGFLGERLNAQRLRSSWWLQPQVQDNNGLDPDGASCGNSDLGVCFLNKRCSTLRGESPTARGPATAFWVGHGK